MSNYFLSVRISGMRYIMKRGLLGGALLGTAVACQNDLTVPNYQNATPESISADAASAVPLLASGVLRNDRDDAVNIALNFGILGREAYNYTPTEARNTTGWLSPDVKNSTSFRGTAASLCSNRDTQLRNIANLVGTITGADDATISPTRKSAGLGFAHTMEGYTLSQVVGSRYNLGAPVDIQADPNVLTPFVSRDSVYRYIVAKLDQGKTELAAGGTTFPLTLHAGYAGFTTPTNYIKFNRAIAAPITAYRASIGASGRGAAKSAACYNIVLANLAESFIDPVGSLTAGPFNVYSSAASDVANGISNQANSAVWAHAKSDSGIQAKVGGALDDRFTAKLFRVADSLAKKPSNPTQG